MKKRTKNIIGKAAILSVVVLIILGMSKCNRDECNDTDRGDNLIVSEDDSFISGTEVEEETLDQDTEQEEQDEDKNEVIEGNKEEGPLEDKKENPSKDTDKKNEVSSAEKNEEPKKPAENKNETDKKPSDSFVRPEEGNEEPKEPSHVHKWEEVKNTTEHQEEGHFETVLVKEAWTEEVPIYEMVAVEICNTCGADITGNTSAHLKEHMLKGENGSRRTEYVQKQTRVEKIQHSEVYEQRWVVDKEAWTETSITYKCSCGQTK